MSFYKKKKVSRKIVTKCYCLTALGLTRKVHPLHICGIEMEQKLIYGASSLNGKTSNNFLEIRSSNPLFAPSLYTSNVTVA